MSVPAVGGLSPAKWRVKVGAVETSAVFEPAFASAGGAAFPRSGEANSASKSELTLRVSPFRLLSDLVDTVRLKSHLTQG